MKTNKFLYYILAICLFLIAGICYVMIFAEDTSDGIVLQAEEVSSASEDKTEPSDHNPLPKEEKIIVHICGAVLNPGVYEFGLESRIIDGVNAAGGFLENALSGYLNLAQKMKDGEKIYVPSKEEAGEDNNSLQAWSDITEEEGKVNINTASASKLTTLPGIGEKKAENIINYREQNGLFQELTDLMKVEGISNSLFEKLKELITI